MFCESVIKMKLIKTNGDTTEVNVTSKTYKEADLFQIGVNQDNFNQAISLVRDYIKNANVDKSKYSLKAIKNDNALLFYRKTNISQNDDYLCHGIFIQFNVAKESDMKTQVCDVKLIEGQSKYFEDMKCVYSLRFQYHFASEGNFAYFKKQEQYEQGLIELWETITKDCNVLEKDTACYIKNYYLMLEKIAVKPNFLYNSYLKIKELDFVEKCRFDNQGKAIFCKIGDKNIRINVLGGDMYEINSYILKDYEQLEKVLKMYLTADKDHTVFMPLNFMGANAPIMEYSKSKNINDLIDPELRRKNFHQENDNKFIAVDNEHQNDLLLG